MTKFDKKILAASLVTIVGFAGTSLAQNQPEQPQQDKPGQTQEQQEPMGQQQEPMGQQPMAEQGECPEFLKGAKLSVSNIDQGIQFRITTDQQSFVDPLRNMAKELSTFVEEHERTDIKQTEGAPPQQAFAPVNIETKSIKNGVVITVKAENKADLKEVRDQAKTVEQAFRSSKCVTGSPSGQAKP